MNEMLMKIVVLVITVLLSIFGAVLQYENIMNLLSFWIWSIFILTVVVMIASLSENFDFKAWRTEQKFPILNFFVRCANVITVIALVYHGYIVLPIVLLLSIFFLLILKESALKHGNKNV
jgi:hypothetical protein